jgi:hypothetical protein
MERALLVLLVVMVVLLVALVLVALVLVAMVLAMVRVRMELEWEPTEDPIAFPWLLDCSSKSVRSLDRWLASNQAEE